MFAGSTVLLVENARRLFGPPLRNKRRNPTHLPFVRCRRLFVPHRNLLNPLNFLPGCENPLRTPLLSFRLKLKQFRLDQRRSRNPTSSCENCFLEKKKIARLSNFVLTP